MRPDPLSAHDRHDRLAHSHRGEHVRVVEPARLLERGVLHRIEQAVADPVHDRIDATEAGYDIGDAPRDGVGVGDIQLDRGDALTGEGGRGRAEPEAVTAERHDHLPTRRHQFDGGGPAGAGAALR